MNVPTVTTGFLDRASTYYDDVIGVIADDGSEFTYREMTNRVHQLSHSLLDLGLDRGDRVAVLSPNTHWCIEAMFAVQQLGMIFVPLNYRLVPSDYEYLLKDSGAAAVIVDYSLAERLDELRESVPATSFICYGSDRARGDWIDYESLLADATPTQPPRPEIGENEPATINYTSGTTGEPKGVVRTHRTDVWNAIIHGYHIGLRDDDVYLWTLPMFHVNGWGAMYMVTGAGGTHICLRDFDARTVFDRIQRHDVSYLSGAPTVLNQLLDYNASHGTIVTQGDSPVTISTAGAPPPHATIQSIEDDFGWNLIHFFGHTESGPFTTSYAPRRIGQKGRMTIKPKQGIPFVGNEIRVVDHEGNDVPRDDETMGEVLLRGNSVFDRYWNKPEETEQAFSDRVDGWFHSGDLGTIDEHGFITLKDRKKDIIISGGENISSIEIEDAIYDLDAVRKTAVIPVPHDKWGETPKALVVKQTNSDLTEADVIAHCKKVIASYKAPTTVEFVTDLPETATGKVKKHQLREQYWEDNDRRISGH